MRRTAYFPVQGGEDLLSPPMAVKPGRLLYSHNYECDQHGRARRIDGFERVDGRPSPSDASYWVINFDAGSAAISANDTVTGQTSSATGTALYDAVVSTGSYGGGDAAGYLVLTGVSGTFQNNENLRVGGVTKSVADGVAVENGADNDEDADLWIAAAQELARDNIAVCPGSGNIRGVWVYNDKRYAFRDNAGGTACVMHVESTSGWTAVDLGKKLVFTSGGVTEIAEGNTITGAISGATAVVKRVVLTSGTWAGGDAAGYFVFTSQTGTFQAEDLNVGATPNLATIAGNSAAITLLPAGRYEFMNHNFFGQSGSYRMYGCDGVNPAFEFDGTVFCPIATRLTTDKPTHIRAFKKHLFLSVTGGTVVQSGTGYPLKFDAASGASEIATGDTCVGMEPQPGGVLAIWGRNRTDLLYGNDSSDWELKEHSPESGAIEHCIQRMSQAVYLDDRGVTSLGATDKFGDFAAANIGGDVAPIINAKKSLAISSLRVRAKDQYRLYFSDNTGLVFTFSSGKLLGITRVDYGKSVQCCCSGEISGAEVLLFGSSDGYVYELDKGDSFDGTDLDAMIQLPFNHLKSPEHNKRFFKGVLELDAPSGVTLSWADDYDYGTLGGSITSSTAESGSALWDISSWDEFIWDGVSGGSMDIYFEGVGKNMGIFLRSTGQPAHTIQGVLLHYAIRGLSR